MLNLIGYSVLVVAGSLIVVLYANYKSKEYRKWLDNLCKKETYTEFNETLEL